MAKLIPVKRPNESNEDYRIRLIQSYNSVNKIKRPLTK